MQKIRASKIAGIPSRPLLLFVLFFDLMQPAVRVRLSPFPRQMMIGFHRQN